MSEETTNTENTIENQETAPEAPAPTAESQDSARSSSAPAPRHKKTFGPRMQMSSKDGQRPSKFKKKVCRFCANKEMKVDYRNASLLESYITDRGKILPRRITGNCAKHQRLIAKAVKRGRILSVVPFVVK